MRKLLLTAALAIVASNQVSAFAPMKEDCRIVYEHIQDLLDKEIIDCKTAQKMWRAYKIK